MQKITPCLCFNRNAEEAAKFYTSIFKKSKIKSTTYYGPNMPLPEGTVLTVIFELDGEEFMALNAGPAFKFSEAISLMVNCKTQKEIDYFWKKLTKGGKIIECGWLKDKYGVSWQVVPTIMAKKVFKSKDQKIINRYLAAVMTMNKPNLKRLKQAYEGK